LRATQLTIGNDDHDETVYEDVDRVESPSDADHEDDHRLAQSDDADEFDEFLDVPFQRRLFHLGSASQLYHLSNQGHVSGANTQRVPISLDNQ